MDDTRRASSRLISGRGSVINGLVEQLESDAGEGFTHEQAVYGADHSR